MVVGELLSVACELGLIQDAGGFAAPVESGLFRKCRAPEDLSLGPSLRELKIRGNLNISNSNWFPEPSLI